MKFFISSSVHILFFAILSLCPATSTAQTVSPEEQKAVNHVLSLYKKMAAIGDPKARDAMSRFENAVKEGKITFGPVPDNDNAISDPATGTITINRRFLEAVNSPKDDALVSQADLAATIIHEFRHLDQGSYKTFGSAVTQCVGLGNRAEQEAWREGLDALTRWILLTNKQLKESKASAREKAWIAKELSFLCDSWIVTRNSYDVQRYGALEVNDPDNPEGPKVPLESAFAVIENIKKHALDQAAIASQITQPFDAVYSGTFQSFFITGTVKLLIRGQTVEATLSNADLDQQLKDYFRGVRGVSSNNANSGDSSSGVFKRLSGTIDVDGNITAYTADKKTAMTGHLSNGKGSGTLWSIEQSKTPIGTWDVSL